MTGHGSLRELLEADELLVIPGAHDALAARIAQRAGYSTVFVGGSAVTNSRLGLPDYEFLSLPEMAEVCRSIREVSTTKPIIDADTGYGNSVNVDRTVRVLEYAGAAAVVIEDQVAPKRSGHVSGKEIVSKSEMCRKVESACAARTDDETLIIARTDARLVEGLEGSITRAQSYRDAGADVLFVESPLSDEEMQAIVDSAGSAYSLLNMGGSGRDRTTPKLPLQRLAEIGYDAAIFVLQPLRAAALAMHQFYSSLALNGVDADIELIESLRGTDLEDWYEFSGLRQLADQAEHKPDKSVE